MSTVRLALAEDSTGTVNGLSFTDERSQKTIKIKLN